MSSFNWPAIGGGSGVATYASFASLPPVAADGTVAVTLDTDSIYVFNAGSSTWILAGGTGVPLSVGTVDSQPAATNGATFATNQLFMQSASASKPGLVNNAAQTLSGIKTFQNQVNADGGIDRSTSGTLTIGPTNASTINIGNSGATINIQGTTLYENVTQVQVKDPLMTLNKGGGVGSAANSGIELEENSVITGYAETSADRNSWTLKAPNTAGVATITPGAGGITLDQSSHSPVTLAAVGAVPNANGATLVGQALNLQPFNSTNPGVVSASGGGSTNFLRADGSWATPPGTGVTAVSVATANGLAGSSGGGTTPIITLSTSVNGVVKGNGTALSAATAGSDYSAGTSGLATGILKSTTTTGALTIAVAADFPTLNQNTTGTANNVTGTVAIGNGGTGQTTQQAAINALTGTQSSGKYLKSDGVNSTLSSLAATDLTGTVVIANGGTNNGSLAVTAGGVLYTDGSKLVNVGAGSSGQFLKSQGASAPIWSTGSFTPTAPTMQTFASGSGTYTKPANVLYLRVRMVGGGGGGAGSSTTAAGNGGAGGTGGNTTFGTTLLAANGGSGGPANSGGSLGGAGGSASLGSGPIGVALSGGQGGGTGYNGATSGIYTSGGVGAATPLGGQGGSGGPGLAGTAAITNSGSGGGGGGAANLGIGGGGGGAGGFVDAIINSPASTYSYAVGAAGAAGTAGTSGAVGGAGGSGFIEVTEYYQ